MKDKTFTLAMPAIIGPITLTDEQTEQIIDALVERIDIVVQAISKEYKVPLEIVN